MLISNGCPTICIFQKCVCQLGESSYLFIFFGFLFFSLSKNWKCKLAPPATTDIINIGNFEYLISSTRFIILLYMEVQHELELGLGTHNLQHCQALHHFKFSSHTQTRTHTHTWVCVSQKKKYCPFWGLLPIHWRVKENVTRQAAKEF